MITIQLRWLAYLILVLAYALVENSQQAQAQTIVKWIGQDGHDFVGTYSHAEKSSIQDIHFVIGGIPRGQKIVSAVIKGHGDGEWKYNAQGSFWLAHLVPRSGGAAADLYVEPYKVEKGRNFEFEFVFQDGSKRQLECKGGKADPNLRMPGTGLEVTWKGHDGQDRSGPSPNVGPDGYSDVHLRLTKLAPKDEIRSILITGPNELRWQFGPNIENDPGIECIRDKIRPSDADLYFQPSVDLSGVLLKLTLTYANEKIDSATFKGEVTNPKQKNRLVDLPVLKPIQISSKWLGQATDGLVRVTLAKLPTSSKITGVELSDGTVGAWTTGKTEGGLLPLAWKAGPGSDSAELRFAPVRDETETKLSLRLFTADGRSWLAEIPGGFANPELLANGPATTSIDASPGDDLNALANQYGTVKLLPGTYVLTKPLVLNKPVTILGDGTGSAIIEFHQASTEPAWTTAIKIHAGRTQLKGFAVRFKGTVRWDQDVSYGPSVIGTTDNRDKSTGQVLVGLAFSHLNLEGPAPATAWEEAPRLMRLVGASNGTIAENTLKGGLIELFDGPWRIEANKYFGTHANAFSQAVFSIHHPHDLVVAKNQIKPLDRAGKTWRFLVLTHRGSNIRVSENVCENVGPRDDDRHEHPNAPETILTESYRLSFEGKTSRVSDDGLVLSVPHLQGEAAGTGSIVAILSGPQAGQWRRIVMPLGPNVFLLDKPVKLGGGAISISPGFTETVFERNVIDDRASKVAKPFVLCGGHFGTKLIGNKTYGGVQALWIEASGSEVPVHWGWSHNAMFGLEIDGNHLEDAWEGSTIGVHHHSLIRSTIGRIYMTASVTNNKFIMSDAFVVSHTKAFPGRSPVALNLGWPKGDAGDFLVQESGNERQGGRPGPSIRVNSTSLNGTLVKSAAMNFAEGEKAASGTRPKAAPIRR